MYPKTKKVFDIIIFPSLGITLAITIFSNEQSIYPLLLLSSFLIASFCIRRKLFTMHGFYRRIGKLTLFLDIGILYFITLLDMSRVSQIYFYVLIMDAVIFCSLRYGIWIAVINYFSYVAIRYLRYIKWNYFDFWYFSPAFFDSLFYFVFVFIVIYVAKQQILQSQLLASTTLELERKTKQLEETNQKLQSTMESFEEIILLKERNRIAHEIHDTVGHTLTTVLVEVEAGKRLMSKNQSLAAEKLDLAQGQVRKGLNDIRQSVRTLQDGSDILELIPALNSLVAETEKHAGIKIKCDFHYHEALPTEIAKVIYRATQEGLANGIRHGRSTQFICSLKEEAGQMEFSMKDDGIGCDKVILGFGLLSMKKRVEDLDGIFEISTSAGNGFNLTIKIPQGREKGYEKNYDIDCR